LNKYSLILGIIGAILLIVFLNTSDKKIDCDQFISRMKSVRYNGIIIKKYIDTNQHNYKKVILKEDIETQVILFDQEEGGVFQYLEKGDSISKKDGDLTMKIVRGEKDSIYKLNYYCLTQKSKK
jgi:hypothetical protein